MATAVHPRSGSPACTPAQRVTKSLLGYGVLAGPFYVLVILAQALLRPGFDLAHDDASLLANGSVGWIQVADFVLTGAMVLAFAAGVRRALAPGRAATWAPALLAAYGLGLIGAGLFTADPMNGFPAGAPAGHPTSMSGHGLLHIAFAGVGFLALVAACFVLARRFSADGAKGLALFSRATGVLFLLGFVAVASGSSSALVVVAFWVALLVVWSLMATVAVRLYRAQGTPPPATAA